MTAPKMSSKHYERRGCVLVAFEDARHVHASAADALVTMPYPALRRHSEELCRELGTGAPQRMTERDGAAVHIELFVGDVERARDVHRL